MNASSKSDDLAADAPTANAWIGRLAPSPTGRLHIGNAYAALAAWLSARSRGGRLVLRIEDIDRPRCKAGADTAIMEDLRWLGLEWDGEPIWQSARTALYDEALQELRREGVIYPCFCSRGQLRAASAPHDDDGFFIYPGMCRRLSSEERQRRLDAGDRHSWRLAMPDTDITVHDRIFGDHTFNLATDCGDVVLRRSDGIVAYQLAVTVDDMAQRVTDIVRGRDLLRSAAIQLWIRHCLNHFDHLDCLDRQAADAGHSMMDAPRPDTLPDISPDTPTPSNPSFAHMPLLDDESGRRLAKRNQAIDVATLRARGVSPQAVVGYCAWLMGIVDSPEPQNPSDLLAVYSEARIAMNPQDRAIDVQALYE